MDVRGRGDARRGRRGAGIFGEESTPAPARGPPPKGAATTIRAMTRGSAGALLSDRELLGLFGRVVVAAPGADAPAAAQVQPASLDLRLGGRAHRLRAGFLPGPRSVERRLAELGVETLDLTGAGAVLERGAVYLVELMEELRLPHDLRARFNPRSSTGRCDVFTRVLACGHPRFDEAPPGYHGRLWMEVSPLSFSVRLVRGDRLGQARFARGAPALSRGELFALHARTPLVFDGARPLSKREVRIDEDGCLVLTAGLSGRRPAGWRARRDAPELVFAASGGHAAADFWEPVAAPGGGAVLEPERFYLFASRERLRVPPDLAAEMLPVDVGLGELRNNYAGFFDSGFGWREDADGRPLDHGTPAVLEVRAHDVPFLFEEGQLACRLRFFRVSERPAALYGANRTGASYQDQDLTLARAFRPA
ncbi:MAG: 2'-deoxycytidine 5'-triphosphate deaminase [Planctomycetes bacterium]|nr:2'-deoxycytidine 5'-triphosphate deaminase [Planctomycetota bacterium]